jgi:hypothetical protein
MDAKRARELLRRERDRIEQALARLSVPGGEELAGQDELADPASQLSRRNSPKCKPMICGPNSPLSSSRGAAYRRNVWLPPLDLSRLPLRRGDSAALKCPKKLEGGRT